MCCNVWWEAKTMDIPLGQALNRATCPTCYILPSTINTTVVLVSWKTGLMTRYWSKKNLKRQNPPGWKLYFRPVPFKHSQRLHNNSFSVIQHSLLPFCRIAAILCAQSRQPTIFRFKNTLTKVVTKHKLLILGTNVTFKRLKCL